MQRKQSNFSGFVFDFSKGTVRTRALHDGSTTVSELRAESGCHLSVSLQIGGMLGMSRAGDTRMPMVA